MRDESLLFIFLIVWVQTFTLMCNCVSLALLTYIAFSELVE